MITLFTLVSFFNAEFFGLNNKRNTFILNIFHINIKKCSFQDVISNSNGGGLLIDNSQYFINILNCLFNNCSANTMGGGLFIKSNSVFISNTCIFKCGARNRLGLNWGHAGFIEISNISNITFSIINNCSPNSNFLGHALLSIRYGNQKINNLNSSNNFALNDWSGYILADSISSHFIYNSCYNFTGYDCILFRVSNYLGYCEKNNFLFNQVTFGAIVSYYFNIKVQDCYFYSNLNDLNIQTSGTINLFGCITNKLNFGTFSTDINCKVLQTSYNPIEFSLYSCNYYDFTLNYHSFHYFLNIFLINIII